MFRTTLGAPARALLLSALLLFLGALPAAAQTRGPTVYGALQSLRSSGELSAEAYGEDSSTYTAALHAVGRLSGTRRAELESVVANVQQIAASGQLIASRLPALMLTLESNVQWWSHEPLPAADQHVNVLGSHLVWEYYPGQGIEIQWLATFGEANGHLRLSARSCRAAPAPAGLHATGSLARGAPGPTLAGLQNPAMLASWYCLRTAGSVGCGFRFSFISRSSVSVGKEPAP